ncbi:MAG TPA: periplasmic heavy metal sensor [Thermoanaerobaculia bacterium]|nr:periplasmic heavy metal sensor [Thermoanaerobaculia bacterium]
MKKRILVITSAVALTALLAVPFAFAQRMRGQGFAGPMFFGHLQHVKQQLGLSDQQVTDIKAIFQDLRQQNQQARQSMRGTMQQAAQILLNNPNDVASAQALLDQQAATEKTLRANALNAMSKALNVLTPDQRAKLSTMLQERAQRMQK